MSGVIDSVPLILVSQGIVAKKGRFSTSEEVAIRGALDSFRVVSVSIFLYSVLNAWVPGEWPLARTCCRYYVQ